MNRKCIKVVKTNNYNGLCIRHTFVKRGFYFVVLTIPPFGASSNIAFWRANTKPPVKLVVDDLEWPVQFQIIFKGN